MFECEMTGCFDSATHDIKFVKESETYQICDSCNDYWKHNDENDVESITEFARHADLTI